MKVTNFSGSTSLNKFNQIAISTIKIAKLWTANKEAEMMCAATTLPLIFLPS
jgi:hypothetical protein